LIQVRPVARRGLMKVWISPVVANIEGQTFDGGAYHGKFLYGFGVDKTDIARVLDLGYNQ